MLMTLVVVLIVLWLLGMVTTYTLGGLLHILLVVAVILLLVRVIQGRPPTRLASAWPTTARTGRRGDIGVINLRL